MKEDENKNAAAAAEQPENDQPLENAEAHAPAPEAGADVDRHDDTPPADGEGCESVTVVIIARDDRHLELIGRLVEKNLTGVDADIQAVTGEHLKDTDVETLLEHLPHVNTERIILMTDGMLILNPVVLGDIACPKAAKKGDFLDFNTLMPVLMHKSALQQLLESLKDEKPHADIVNEYFGHCMPKGFQPVVLRDIWREESWLMPVASKQPSIDALRQWGKTQKFAHIGPDSWTEDVIAYLQEKLSE